MKLIFKQRIFSWLDSYDIYDEMGNSVYTVKGQLSWGHCLKIFDQSGRTLGMVKERVLTFLPKFEVYRGNEYLGCIAKEFSLFRPRYDIDYNDWHVEDSIMEWDYRITAPDGGTIASVSKELLHLSDTYVLTIADPKDALTVLMFVLAIDAEKCSRD